MGLIALCLCFTSYAQNINHDYIKGLVVQSPNVAALGRFGDIPVGNYTGTPNISVPIFAIEEGNLKVGVSCHYHAGGVGVSTTASSIGLGWALNAGGMIGRTVRGKPDDKDGGWYTFGSSQIISSNFPPGTPGYCDDYEAVANGLNDTESDLYYFSFGPFSGKFVFDTDGTTPRLIEGQDLKITPLTLPNPAGGFDYFMITAADGTKYYFGNTTTSNLRAVETTQSASFISDCYGGTSNTQAGYQFLSAWYLTRIEAGDGKTKIDFDYNEEIYSFNQLGNARKTLWQGISCHQQYTYSCCNGPTCTAVDAYSPMASRSVTQIWGLAPKSITWSNGSIIFERNDIREDVYVGPTNKPKKINKIIINDNTGTCLKKFIFNTDYFVSDIVGNPIDLENYKRLRLKKIIETNCSETTNIEHVFQYNHPDENGFTYKMPYKLSYSQDHWGYFNGKNNTNLIPSGGYTACGNANREADAAYVQVGVLKKITYPTGGETLFEYELHDYLDQLNQLKTAGGLRVKTITSIAGYNAPPKVVNYEYKKNNNTSSGLLLTPLIYQSNVSSWGFQRFADCNVSLAAISSIAFSYPILSTSRINGSPVTYSQVKVISSNNGYSIFEYNNGGVYVHSFPSDNFPSAPELQPYIESGKIKSEKHYKEGGTLLKSTTYEYTVDLGASIVGQAVISFPNAITFHNNCCLSAPCYNSIILTECPNKYARADYMVRWGDVLLTKVTDVVDGVTTVTDITYQGQGLGPAARPHHNPITKTFTNSDGKVFKDTYFYAYEYKDSYAWAQAMFDKYMVSLPIYKEHKIGTTKRAELNEYSTGFGNNYPYLSQYKELMSNDYWDTKFTINTYDMNNGFPKQITLDGFADSYTYNWTGTKLTSKQFKDLTWTYTYKPGTNLVETTTDENAQKVKFEYDDFLRLYQKKTMWEPTGQVYKVTSTYTYNYKTAQNTDNYILTETVFADGTTSQKTRDYVDWLGRPLQTMRVDYSPNAGKSIATNTMTYDNAGRTIRSYIPFETNSGAYTAVPVNTVFTENTYEKSPLDRVEKVIMEDGNFITYAYGANTGTDNVLKFTVATPTQYYSANSLFKKTTTDENGNVTIEFFDQADRLILSRKFSDGQSFDTYYVYDDYNRLQYIVPPGVSTTTSAIAHYRGYDFKHRLYNERIPDASLNRYYFYDSRDLLTLYQDGNMRTENAQKYLFKKYDDYGREVKTGFSIGVPPYNTTTSDVALTFPETEVLTTNTYTTGKNRLQTKSAKVLSSTLTGNISYNYVYDVYNRVTGYSANNQIGYSEYHGTTYNFNDNVLTENHTHFGYGTSYYSTKYRFTYDNGLRLKDTYHQLQNYLSEVLLSNLQYTTRDEVKERNLGSTSTTTPNYLQSVDYAYNSRGWLTRINQLPLSTNNLMIPTCTESNNPTPSAYIANSDGDTKLDLFGETLNYYNNDASVGATGQKNGNIATMKWQIFGRRQQIYGYTYDGLDRLKTATYNDVNDAGVYINSLKYNEAYTYDKRGNFLTLTRNGARTSCTHNGNPANEFGQIDNLVFTYTANSNKIATITDNSGYLTKGFYTVSNGSTLTYDNNGNLKSDPNKKITLIEYYYHNMPKKITFSTGESIEYSYDAWGTKLRKIVKNASGVTMYTKDYFGEVEYNNQTVESILHKEGRLKPVGTSFRYEYAIRDHLGNMRVLFSDVNSNNTVEPSTELSQINQYYPFGLNMEGNWNGASGAFKYQFGNKELNNDHMLTWSDFGLRFYDASIGRWLGVDPLAEEYPEWSTYNYTFNNPLSWADPTGAGPEPCEGCPNWDVLLDEVVITASRPTNDVLDWVHVGLDILGSVPVIGEAADFLNGTIYTIRGDYENAGISFAAMIPVVGDAGKVYKYSNKAYKLAKKANPALKKILPGWKKVKIDMEHVVSGHTKDGWRVMKGSKKDLFPDGMDAKQIEKAVRQAYKNVSEKVATQGDRVLVRGATDDGMQIEMWINTATKSIETAYPVLR